MVSENYDHWSIPPTLLMALLLLLLLASFIPILWRARAATSAGTRKAR